MSVRINAMSFMENTMLSRKEPMLTSKRFVAFRQFGANFPTQIASTFYFSPTQQQPPQKIKRACNPPRGFTADTIIITALWSKTLRRASGNSTYKQKRHDLNAYLPLLLVAANR